MFGRPKVKLARREFLGALGAGATSAVSASPLLGEARADTKVTEEKRRSRYRETEHVKAFYHVNRYTKT
jgi:hypothetical protein